MAVAERTTPAAMPSRDPRQVLMVHGILGALFFLASLWLIFVGLPTLWRIIDMATLFNEFLADSLLFLVALPTIFGLFILGRILEGPNPVRGLRAASFYLSACIVAFGLLTTSGNNLGSGIGLVLLGSSFVLYFQPWFLDWLIRCEEQGWFHAAAFKANQGQRVRRATVIAVMVIVICGVVTMITHGSLRTGTYQIAKPFGSNEVQIEALETQIAELEKTLKVSDQGKADIAERLRVKREELDVAHRRGWAEAVDPWMVTMPFGTAKFVFMYRITLTVPVLVLVVAGWFAWRLVNWPAFADFLIATEAEMNKVSWTTRKRLYQDTIVVLATVILMTVFLFAVDILWIKILTNPLIDVLKHNPQDAVRRNQQGAQW